MQGCPQLFQITCFGKACVVSQHITHNSNPNQNLALAAQQQCAYIKMYRSVVSVIVEEGTYHTQVDPNITTCNCNKLLFHCDRHLLRFMMKPY